MSNKHLIRIDRMIFSSDQDGHNPLHPVFLTDYNEILRIQYKKQLPEDSEKYTKSGRFEREIQTWRSNLSECEHNFFFF